ncbi:ATP-binding protein [Butyrivibrio sp. JL13D10]|uniref:ATP-binding protein n=1 Tax=Butyrivibrio sp. JL13D10 TaxID=3236815 RepID=UPI0038B662E3
MNNKLRYLTGQMIAVLIVAALVMVALGAFLNATIEKRLSEVVAQDITVRARAAADYYSEHLLTEMVTLEHIGAVLEKDVMRNDKENENRAKTVIDYVFMSEPSVLYGIMDAEKNPLYGGSIEASEYDELLYAFRGNSGVSYMQTGALLFSYSVLHGDNVRYVLYAICPSAYVRSKHGLGMINNIGNVCVMNSNGESIIPFSYAEKGDSDFFNSKSVKNLYKKIRREHNHGTVGIEKAKTIKGDMFFFSAEIKNTPFVLAGAIDYKTAMNELAIVRYTTMTVYVIFLMIGLVFAVMLILSSVKIRESNELREAKQIAEDAAKAKGLFLANMSHEIRTPINAILGMDEMILRQTRDGKLLQYAHSIKSSATSLLSLVNDVLDFSAIEAGKLKIKEEPYDISVMLTDISVMVKKRAEDKGLTFSIGIDREMPDHLIGDVTRIKQIIINIVTNGIKYTREGFVHLGISFEKISDEEITLEIAVKDTGIGMKQENIDKLFLAFERFDENKNRTIEGTGLGMSIVKQILDAMHGELDVRSVYGAGTEFSVRINQKVANWEKIEDYEDSAQRAALNKENYQPSFYAPDIRILAVDDMEINLRVVEGLLEQTGVLIDSAISGRQALELIRKNRYDIMLIDHRMPEMDGVELLQNIRGMTNNDNSKSVCIALTANVTEGVRDKYISFGFDDYLEKPVNGLLLEKTILQYIPKDKLKDVADREATKALREVRDETDTNSTDEDVVPADDNISDEAPAETDVKTELKRLENEGVIDMTNVLEYAGTEDIYIDTLRFYKNTIDKKADEIEQLFNDNNIEDYTIKVHALKSSSKMVGLMELSEMARLLEMAGKNGDIDYIKDNTEKVLEKYRSYNDILANI